MARMHPPLQEQCSRLFALLSLIRQNQLMAAPRTARAIARVELTRAILDSATTQLGEVGPAALSVRAVARDLDMASSAVYRYFDSRDALLTGLIIEAYDALGEAVEIADAGCTRADHLGRWRSMCHAVRDWARAHPHQYALTYGSPVPGYAAPADTIASGTRVAFALLRVVAEAAMAGAFPASAPLPISPAEAVAIAPVLTFVEPALSPAYAVRATAAWATLFGHLSLELFGHMFNGILDYDVHFAHVVDQVGADLGLTSA